MEFPMIDATGPRRLRAVPTPPDRGDDGGRGDAARSLAESSRRAATRERGRLTRELDDLIGHRLSSLAAHGRAAALAAREPDEHGTDSLDASLRAVLDLTESALADLREFVSGLHTDPEPAAIRAAGRGPSWPAAAG
jgi:signal transduction histidine kinase